MVKKLIFIMFVIGLAACSNQEKNTKATALQMPDSLSANEQVVNISRQIEANPENAELFYQRAIVYYNQKYLGMADADLLYAINLDSTNALYWFWLARVNYAMNQTKKAAEYYEKAIALKPDYTEAMIKLADLYFIVKEHQKSIAILQNLKKIDKENAYVYHMLGLNYRDLKDTSRAIYYFQTATEYDEKDYDSFLYLANLYAAKLQPIAFDYYRNAIKIKPNSTEAYFARAVLAQKLKQYKQAVADYRFVIDKDPENDKAYYNVGYINFEIDQLDEALRNFNIATRMNNDFVEAYYMKGLIYEIKGNKKEAKINYDFALKLNNNFELAKEGLNRVK